MGISVAHGSELKTEDNWFEFDDTNIPHVKISFLILVILGQLY
jgi:hypothetical protein